MDTRDMDLDQLKTLDICLSLETAGEVLNEQENIHRLAMIVAVRLEIAKR